MTKIVVRRIAASREWTIVIPVDQWDGFQDYIRETRLPARTEKTGREEVTIVLPDGFTKSDILDTIGFSFDGVAEIEVAE